MLAEQRWLRGRAARGFLRRALDRSNAGKSAPPSVDLFGALPAATGSTEHREPRLCLSV
jgi:hypothetical protein